MLLDQIDESEKTPSEESPFHLVEEEGSKSTSLSGIFKELEQLKQKNAEFEKRIQELTCKGEPKQPTIKKSKEQIVKKSDILPVSNDVPQINIPSNIKTIKRKKTCDTDNQPKKKPCIVDEETRKLRLEKLIRDEAAKKEREEKAQQEQKEKDELLALKKHWRPSTDTSGNDSCRLTTR